MEMPRLISNLPNLNELMAKMICEMVISDMKNLLTPHGRTLPPEGDDVIYVQSPKCFGSRDFVMYEITIS